MISSQNFRPDSIFLNRCLKVICQGKIPEFFPDYFFSNSNSLPISPSKTKLNILPLSLEAPFEANALANNPSLWPINQHPKVKEFLNQNNDNKELTFGPYSLSAYSGIEDSYLFYFPHAFGERFLRNKILELVFNLCVFDRNLFLHASGIKLGDKTAIFTGFSDSGKSTISGLFKDKFLLSDDIVFYTADKDYGEKPSFVSSCFGRESDGENHGQAAAIFFLVKSTEFSIRKVSRVSGLKRLLLIHQVYITSLFQNHRKDFALLAKQMLENVPAYEIHFQKDQIDQEAVEQVMNGRAEVCQGDALDDMKWLILSHMKKDGIYTPES